MEDYYDGSSDDEYYNRVYDDVDGDDDVDDLEETDDPLSWRGGGSCKVNWSVSVAVVREFSFIYSFYMKVNTGTLFLFIE